MNLSWRAVGETKRSGLEGLPADEPKHICRCLLARSDCRFGTPVEAWCLLYDEGRERE
jgi:hypothetical protein